MKKIKFMLLSLALVAVVGGALAFKARYVDTFCTTFAQRANVASPWTCSIPGQPVLTCPTIIFGSTVTDPNVFRPVCTTILSNGTCGDVLHPLDCINATVSIKAD